MHIFQISISWYINNGLPLSSKLWIYIIIWTLCACGYLPFLRYSFDNSSLDKCQGTRNLSPSSKCTVGKSMSLRRGVSGRYLGLSLWLSGLIRFLSHSTCWALLAGDLQWPGIKSQSRHELSVGWTNGRYAMRLISRTGTEGPPVSSLNCDRCRLWSHDITAGYKCEYYYYYLGLPVQHRLSEEAYIFCCCTLFLYFLPFEVIDENRPVSGPPVLKNGRRLWRCS